MAIVAGGLAINKSHNNVAAQSVRTVMRIQFKTNSSQHSTNLPRLFLHFVLSYNIPLAKMCNFECYIHCTCGSTSFSHQNVYLNTVFPSVIQLQLPPLVCLLCTSPPPPSLSTGHLQLPHPPDTISLTLLEQSS